MNKIQQHLQHCEQRISSININKPEGWEATLHYLTIAKEDILKQLTEEEVTEVFNVMHPKVQTAEEREEEMTQYMEEMKFNRDKNAI